MPTELEELVEFLHHGNTQIRQIAVENLVPYSKTEPTIFKTAQLTPVKDLKLLIRDYAPIAKNALTILINISSDAEILKSLAEDDAFLESVLLRITNPKEKTANDLSMLLANLSKSPSLERLLDLKRAKVPALSSSDSALGQLIDLFNLGSKYNSSATFDYLAYVFADLAKFTSMTRYLLSQTPEDPFPVITKLIPSTTHPSLPRRLGISLLLKNFTLTSPSPTSLLHPPISILPFLLLPLCGPYSPDAFTDEEMESMLTELQYLGPEHVREEDKMVIGGILDVLYLLAVKGEKEGRRILRAAGGYFVVRELHVAVEDEGVREGCERLVHVLMQDDEGEGMQEVEAGSADGGTMMTEKSKEEDESDDDDRVVEIF
ncbi:hypothetical protein MMC31_001085 [Peltigera leucophlebia]|nr:hypothetical protein [Peltigera leucophlebia]